MLNKCNNRAGNIQSKHRFSIHCSRNLQGFKKIKLSVKTTLDLIFYQKM